jgi:hypothetical protein
LELFLNIYPEYKVKSVKKIPVHISVQIIVALPCRPHAAFKVQDT